MGEIMKISAVYIAKNEENCIRKSIESVRDSVDELILVDTGSTDKTMEIFRSYGGTVYQQKWQNNFSLPRNFALSKTDSEWIILLDADEYFSNETMMNLRQVINENSTANGFLIKKININEETGEELDSFYDFRVVRNQKGLGYKGRIHEELLLSGEPISNLCKISPEILTIIHTGYTPQLSKLKAERNLTILLDEISNGRNIEELYTYLAECYDGLDNVPKMLEYAHKDIALGRRKVTYASRSYRKLINYYAKHGTIQHRLEFVLQAVNDFPELPEFHAEYAQCLMLCYEYESAIKEMENAITLYSDYNGIEPCLLEESALERMYSEIKKMHSLLSECEKINISACVICKNEAHNMNTWLNNVNIFADEIILVDTGSEDNTLEWGQALGAKCYKYEWNDDFAAAKNFAIEKATGDWIVFIDADEVFYNPQRVRGFINEINKTAVEAVMLPRSDVDVNANYNEVYRFNTIRIFRNISYIRYFGKIHECLSHARSMGDAGSLNIAVVDDRLLLRHTGYSSSIIGDKLKRNLNLLKLEIEESGLQERHYLYLAECYLGLGEYQKALKYGFMALDSKMQPIGQRGNMYWLIAKCLQELNYSYTEQKALLNSAVEDCPQQPEFSALLGQLEIRFFPKNIEIALFYFNEAFDKAKEYSGASYFMSMLSDIYCTMGKCYFSLGDKINSISYINKALDINMWYEDAIIALCDIYNCRPEKELLTMLQERYIYQNNQLNKKLLKNVFKHNGAKQLAIYFDNSLSEIYKMMDDKNCLDKILPEIVVFMQLLFVSLLQDEKFNALSPINKEQLKLLPEALKKIILIYHENLDVNTLKDEDYNSYNSMLPVVLNNHLLRVKKRYLSLAEGFSDKNILKVAHNAFQHELWEQSFLLYQLIGAETVENDGIFWFETGVCLYQLDNKISAAECLEKALKFELTNDNMNKAKSYLYWCQEAMV